MYKQALVHNKTSLGGRFNQAIFSCPKVLNEKHFYSFGVVACDWAGNTEQGNDCSIWKKSP